MAKNTQSFTSGFAFYEALWHFYSQNRGKIRSRYNNLTRKFLAYNDADETPGAFLRRPQFEALEMYVFIKEFLNNQQVYEIFDKWRNLEGKFSERSYYSLSKGGQQMLTDAATEIQTDAVFKQMKKYRGGIPELHLCADDGARQDDPHGDLHLLRVPAGKEVPEGRAFRT